VNVEAPVAGIADLVSAPGQRSHTRGFSLIELMVVLGVVAVILVIAAPGYSVLTFRTKIKSHANELVTGAYLARSEAIKRNVPMTMCISTDGTTCAGGGDWDAGWIIISPDNLVIKHRAAVDGNVKLFELSSIDTVTFGPSGVTSTAATFKICQQVPEQGIEERKVTIAATGRPRVETTLNGCPGS
jgi:type IV fimbrial biogenesis protein FimT